MNVRQEKYKTAFVGIHIAPPNGAWDMGVFRLNWRKKKLCFGRGTRKMPGQFDVRFSFQGRGCADEISCGKRARRLDHQCNLGRRVRYVANGALVCGGGKIVCMEVGLGTR
jgi:hypothetical protein